MSDAAFLWNENVARFNYAGNGLKEGSRQPHATHPHTGGRGSKLNRGGYAGFGPCFHLPGFHLGYRFFEPQPGG